VIKGELARVKAKLRKSRLGEFLVYVLFMIRMKTCSGSCLNCEIFQF